MSPAGSAIQLNTERVRPVLAEKPAKGRVLTFYSYKGGTGRSMALANVAWLLALNNQRVLVIDWDLEAPGIHRFFHPFMTDKELSNTSGLLDLVADLAAQSATTGEERALIDIDPFDYVLSLEWPRDSLSNITWSTFGERARIDLIPAGRQGVAYSTKLSLFNWIDFYERLGGRRLLANVMRHLQSVYDYILIDSRTGVSDTSGICTVELPDTVVACFTLNDQSIFGADAVAQSIRQQRRQATAARPSESFPVFRIFPVPTRVEITSERTKREAALELAQRVFASFLPPEFKDDHGKYWGAVQMAYFPFYAFEEIPAVFGDRPGEVLSLTTSVLNVSRIITDLPMKESPRLSSGLQDADQVRKEILSWYLRSSREVLSDAVSRFKDVYDRLDRDQQSEMKRVLLRLVVVGSMTNASAKGAAAEEFDEYALSLVHYLAGRGLLELRNTGGRSTIEIADPTVVQHWQTLKGWIDEDRPFLIWRLGLAAALDAWRISGQDEGFYLRGKALEEAVTMAANRGSDLSAAELIYINESVAVVEKSIDSDGGGLGAVSDERLQRERLELERLQLEVARQKLQISAQQGFISQPWAIIGGITLTLLALYSIWRQQEVSAERVQAEKYALEAEVRSKEAQQQLRLLTDQLQRLQAENYEQRQRLEELVNVLRKRQ